MNRNFRYGDSNVRSWVGMNSFQAVKQVDGLKKNLQAITFTNTSGAFTAMK